MEAQVVIFCPNKPATRDHCPRKDAASILFFLVKDAEGAEMSKFEGIEGGVDASGTESSVDAGAMKWSSN